MQFKTIFRILGILLMIFSFAMLPPEVVALYYEEAAVLPFLSAFGVTFITGALLWYPFRHENKDLMNRDGFIVVVLFWTVLTAFGSLPFLLGHLPGVSFTDAMFESVSGLTASGCNVVTGLDFLPRAILFYRQQLHFLGGMGIIVLAVAILPMLGIGGMSLYRAETPGPIKDNKLTPRLAETAKALWYIYVGLAISCAVALRTAGLDWFDAIGESFSIVSTGGFSLHDASLMEYQNVHLEIIAIVFMMLGGTNFGLHYQFLRYRRVQFYWRDPEFRTFIFILGVVTAIVTFTLWSYHVYPDFQTTLLKAVFTVVSLGTTTGLKNTSFANWPTLLPYLIMVIAVIGGCAASTSGGLKVIRVLLLQKQGAREIKQLIHPKAVIPIKLGDQALPDHVVSAVWGFLGIFVALFVLLVLLLLASGLDVVTSFAAVAVTLSNAGAGIAGVASNFDNINTFSKWVLIFAMIAGRLEIFSLLVLFSPSFWRD